MASLNLAQIIGNIGRDPESRYMPSGECVTSISVATTDKWKDKATGESKEQTEWHKVTFFGKLAEIARDYLKKGSPVYVSGSIKTRKYTDKDGIEKYATEIKGDTLQMLARNEDAAKDDEPRHAAARNPAPAARQQSRPAQQRQPVNDLNDEIPF